VTDTYKEKLRQGDAVDEIWYNTSGYCLYNGAELAAELGVPVISGIEFGVASGDGLEKLEYHAKNITEETGTEVGVYGFDSMEGLPKPTDYKDMPYLWEDGQYEGDLSNVKEKIEDSELIIGNVAETVPAFVDEYDPAPIGCVVIDLDLYSSTAEALELFNADHEAFLPRLPMYFDDVNGPTLMGNFNRFTGELRAIDEFNEAHDRAKIARPRFMNNKRIEYDLLLDRIYTHHRFDHPSYNTHVG